MLDSSYFILLRRSQITQNCLFDLAVSRDIITKVVSLQCTDTKKCSFQNPFFGKNSFLLFKPRCNLNFSFSLKRAEVQGRNVMTHSILLPHLWNESEMPHVVWRESFLEVPLRRPWLQVSKPYVRKPKRWGLKMPFVAFLLSHFFLQTC